MYMGLLSRFSENEGTISVLILSMRLFMYGLYNASCLLTLTVAFQLLHMFWLDSTSFETCHRLESLSCKMLRA